MVVAISEFKTNPGYYIELAAEQPVRISRHGKIIARIEPEQLSKKEAWRRLRALPKLQFDYDALRMERIGS